VSYWLHYFIAIFTSRGTFLKNAPDFFVKTLSIPYNISEYIRVNNYSALSPSHICLNR